MAPGKSAGHTYDPDRGIRARLFAHPAYVWTLRGRVPDRVRLSPPDPWAGDPEAGLAILKGRMAFADGQLPLSRLDALPDSLPAPRRDAVHGFAWLRDLRAFGSDRAPPKARDLIGGWLDGHGRWRADAWRADLLAERLVAWLTHFDFVTDGAEQDFTARLLGAIAAQARHLRRTVRGHPANARLLKVLKGLAYVGLCLPGFERHLEATFARLQAEIERQIQPDGGHIERCPATQAAVLADLLDLRAMLLAAHQEVPPFLQMAIDRMAPLLRALRHGDGGLALFNGGGEGERTRLDALFALAKARGRALASAPHSGFHRLSAGRTTIIVDAGPPPPPGADRAAHAGTLSFEASVGRERLIVNCGVHADADPAWSHAVRTTAAHSTATLGDVNSSDVLDEGGLGRRPSDVPAARREVDGNLLIEASHDGYAAPFGLIHQRMIFLSADGADIRGEDSFEGRGSPAFAVRFHLHPKVQVSTLPEGGILLKAGSSGWRFRADGGEVGLEDSVYLGTGTARRTRQIVISGKPAGGAVVKWRLSKV